MIKVLLPIYNESESIYDLLENFSRFFDKYNFYEHVIYAVNDNSTDDTEINIKKAIENFKNLNIKYIKNASNRGLAQILKENIKTIASESKPNDILITMDGDNTHNPFTIFEMTLKLEKGADIVIASRYCEASRIKGLSNKRILLSRIAKFLYSLRWQLKGVKDYTCNYRAYKMTLLKKLIKNNPSFISQKEFSAVGEILKNLSKYNPIIVEVPMILNYSNKKGSSNINLIKTILCSIKLLIKN